MEEDLACLSDQRSEPLDNPSDSERVRVQGQRRHGIERLASREDLSQLSQRIGPPNDGPEIPLSDHPLEVTLRRSLEPDGAGLLLEELPARHRRDHRATGRQDGRPCTRENLDQDPVLQIPIQPRAADLKDARQAHARGLLNLRINLDEWNRKLGCEHCTDGRLPGPAHPNQRQLLWAAGTEPAEQLLQLEVEGRADIREPIDADVALAPLQLNEKPWGDTSITGNTRLSQPQLKPSFSQSGADHIKQHERTILHIDTVATP